MYQPYNENGSNRYLFSRDCLKLNFEITKDKFLTIYLNHLKSKYVDEKDPIKKAEKEKKDNKLREKQANKVADIVLKEFKGDAFNKEDFIVLGDFNDTPDSPYLKRLVKKIGLHDVISRLGENDRWTHWWESKNIVSQIDHILLSPHLAKNSPNVPYIERRGISRKIKKFSHLNSKDGKKIPFDFERFPEVNDKVEASDHCPVFFDLII
jgi:predicted extracellular nuclease